MTATSQHLKNCTLVVFVIHQDLTRWLRTYTDTSRFLRTKFWHQSQKVWHQSQIYFVINFQFYLSWAPHSPYLSLASVMPVTCTRQVYRSSKGPKVLVWWSVLFLLLGLRETYCQCPLEPLEINWVKIHFWLLEKKKKKPKNVHNVINRIGWTGQRWVNPRRTTCLTVSFRFLSKLANET